MKNLLCTFTLISLNYLFGCGNDSTTNTGNGNGGETVIFSMDSLSINMTSNLEVKDTLFYLANASNIRITFNCNTNVDSISGFGFIRVTAGDSIMVYKDTVIDNISLLNSDHTLLINASSYYALTLLIQLSRGNSNPYFMRLRNIRVIKL